MTAEIISIGDELLIGQVVNTNASWISQRLDAAGFRVLRHQTVPDNEDDIIKAIKLASQDAGVIIMTGGLGPTDDDKTRDTLCSFYNDSLVMNEAVLDDITGFFKDRGLELTERNRDQARVPLSCVAIRNKNGTAPGYFFDKNGLILVSLPGVPYEMKAMIDEFVIPEISGRSIKSKVIHKHVMTIGIGESFLADKISEWEHDLPQEFKLAYLPSAGMVRLRLTCNDAGSDSEKGMEKILAKLEGIIGNYIYSYRDESIEMTLSGMLLERQQNVSTAESCSGGFIASSFTKLPGCSDWFAGGLVSYANEVKVTGLGVSKDLIREKGVVSEEVAVAMAEGVRVKIGTDWAIATTGIAGPEGGTDDVPVGTVWVGIAGPHGSRAKRFRFTKDRIRNIELTKLFAINELRIEMIKVQSKNP
jgi:nicotinamide-nucleotide amidase